MLKHEAKLIDPDAPLIVSALTDATVAANKRCRARLLADDPAKWRKFARAVAAKPEGWEMFCGGRGGVPATQVLAAWWTDAIGRKHVVVRGRRVEHDEAKRLLLKEELAARTPLWHAYPEYVCRRTVGGTEQIVCACGCGAVGTPESLGWMGETCGPCFDRKEELGAAGLRANLPGVLYGERDPLGALGALACSPDGNRVAAREGDDIVCYWDMQARTPRTVIEFSGGRVTDVAITSDNQRLLVTGMGYPDTRIGLLAVFDVTTDPPQRIDTEGTTASPGWRIVALPDSGLALFHRWSGRSVAEIVRIPSGEVVRSLDLKPDSYGRFALSPDGTRFITCGPDPVVAGVNSMRVSMRLPIGTNIVAFSHDGKRVFAQNNGRLVAYDSVTGAQVISVTTNRDRVPDYTRSLAIDPAGEFVYAGSNYNGRLFAVRADTLKLHATFDWHLGPINGLAISADGSRLFSAGGDGCVKVWPIRDLLRGT